MSFFFCAQVFIFLRKYICIICIVVASVYTCDYVFLLRKVSDEEVYRREIIDQTLNPKPSAFEDVYRTKTSSVEDVYRKERSQKGQKKERSQVKRV
jgi:hypothetical protein